ncbi:MAG TPA: nucleoside-diphosphate kinase [Rhizobiaceae bacterium]|nr:nucleoside-diphosphate kinase [Rhizobiaceae bacterium]
MSNESFVLTTKDFTILEVMYDRRLGRDDPLLPLLKRKLDAAVVVFREDVPESVATLNSRVAFSVNGKDTDTRIISHDRMTSPIGLFLPITTARGLALLGLAEGQVFFHPDHDGMEEQIMLEKVLYQPETARREKDALARLAPARGKPSLTLVRGSLDDRPGLAPVGPDGFDDPGPSAA